jgi:hypothetical protein
VYVRYVTRQQRQQLRKLAGGLGVEGPGRAVWEPTRPNVRRYRRATELFRAALAVLLSPDSNCVDAGAHRGDLLADIVRIAPEGRHGVFEPLPAFAVEIRERFTSAWKQVRSLE